MHYDMTAYKFHVQLLLFIITYILVDKILADKAKLGKVSTWANLILVLLLHTFIIGTGQFVAVFFAIIATFCLNLLMVKRKFLGLIKASIVIILFVLCTITYMMIVGANTHSLQNKRGYITEKIALHEYYTYSLSNIGWSHTALEKIASSLKTLNYRKLRFLLGLITVALMLYSIIIYFSTKQYRLTSLPILLIFHVLCYIGLVLLGRSPQAVSATIALSARYVGTFSLLMVSLVIINAIFLASQDKGVRGTLV